jgi:hypothetical protein
MAAVPATVPGALAALGAGVVDHAGLFPPAALDMATAVADHAAYRAADDAWLLGRFVVPVARLDEWRAAMAVLPDHAARDGWRLSALLGADPAADCDVVRAFNAEAPWGAQVDVLEGKAATPDAIAALARMVPAGVTCYVELPHRDDPRDLVRALRTARLRAKLRTGGIVADAFPTPGEIVRFLRRCHDAGVACKATAGLHHPLRGEYRLTYADDAARAPMYGWVNVVAAAAALADGHDDAVAERLLLVSDPDALTVDDEALTLAGVTIGRESLAAVRASGLIAFGSCSFREPVDELQAIVARRHDASRTA